MKVLEIDFNGIGLLWLIKYVFWKTEDIERIFVERNFGENEERSLFGKNNTIKNGREFLDKIPCNFFIVKKEKLIADITKE